MLTGFRDNAACIYHYTSIKVVLEHILPANKLKAGRYLNTNDPKESKMWSFSAGTNQGRDLGEYNLEDLSERMTRGLKSKTNVVCFSSDRQLTGNHVVDIHNRGFSRPRMWAQYADNHKGVCLIFGREAIQNALHASCPDHQIVGGPVSYVNRGIVPELSSSPYAINVDHLEAVGEERYLIDHVHTHHRRLYFEKCEDWRDEVEYRWVLFGSEEGDVFFDFKKALSGIVFGVSCPQEDIDAVVSLCRSQKRTPWYEQLVWNGCAPWVSWNFVMPG